MNWNQDYSKIGENYTARAIAQMQRGCEQAGSIVRMNWGDGDSDWERLSRENGREVIGALERCGLNVETGPTVPGDHGLHLIAPSLDAAMEFLLGNK